MQKKEIPIFGNERTFERTLRGRILVGGHLVYATTDDLTSEKGKVIPRGLIAQAPRPVYGSRWWQRLTKPVGHVYLHVHPLVTQATRSRIGLLIDGYLAWGRTKREGTTVLIGGLEQDDQYELDVLVFQGGVLVSLEDFELPLRSSQRFAGAVQSFRMQFEERYKDAKFFVSAPLENNLIPGAAHIGRQALRQVSFRSIKAEPSVWRDYLPAAGVLATALAFYCAAIGIGYTKRAKEEREYDALSKSAEIVRHGGMDAGYVGVMTQLRVFMETERKQIQLTNAAARIVAGVATLKDAKILELQTPPPTTANPTSSPVPGVSPTVAQELNADASLRISVPKADGPAMSQVHDLIVALAASTHMDWRPVPHGWKDNGARRDFALEGFIQ